MVDIGKIANLKEIRSMTLVPVSDGAAIAGVSVTTLRNYIREQKLIGYQKSGKTYVDRDEVLTVFGAKPLTSRQDKETRIIVIANQKGGVGKTTTAVAVASILARESSVLAVDCDPQGNMTQAFGFNPDEQEKTLYNVFVDERPLSESFLQVGPPPPSLFLVPANLDLADTWRRVAGRVGLETLLKTNLESALSQFQYIILDCPPSLDMLTINALVAATEVIIPVDMSVFSVRGMIKLLGTVQEVRKVNPHLPLPKIVAVQTGHTNVSQSIEESLREKFKSQVFKTSIPRGKDIPAAHAARTPLPYYA
ncbi:MAG TPA: AAA family ATPase, partial [Nitrososphaera sp.]|nr:AAA family ATPase [Nitrososphaera sp.]